MPLENDLHTTEKNNKKLKDDQNSMQKKNNGAM
jgi:hypothetical protein